MLDAAEPRGAEDGHLLQTEFQFGSTIVRIIQGDMLCPGVSVDVVASSDDNHFTMGAGLAARLATKAGLSSGYVQEARARCPVRAGEVVATRVYGLKQQIPGLQYVFHGAVIDFDSNDLSLAEIAYRVTANCLEKAEALHRERIREPRVRRVLLPAFGTGAGKLNMAICAREMCRAIKSYLARDRVLKAIYLLLYLPEDAEGPIEPPSPKDHRELNRQFIREANLVLGVPFDPSSQESEIRCFHLHATAKQRLESVVASAGADRHVAILGGPRIGKSSLLDHFYCQSLENGGELGRDRYFVRAAFGHVLLGMPTSFIYRKLLLCLRERAVDREVKGEITKAYADVSMGRSRFVEFVARHYRRVVFVIDELPQLLQMGEGAREFWSDLGNLEQCVQFVFTAADNDQYRELSDLFRCHTQVGLEEVQLACVQEDERRAWATELYQTYLRRDPEEIEHDFIRKEAGQHPYLISLTCYALIEAIKRDALTNPKHPSHYNSSTLAPFFQRACSTIERPRQGFFNRLGETITDELERVHLIYLARATAAECARTTLIQDAAESDIDAAERLQELLTDVDHRQLLQSDVLRRLRGRGYLVYNGAGTDDRALAQFMAPSFGAWLTDFLSTHRRVEQPTDLAISLLVPDPEMIRTFVRSRGGRIVMAQKRLPREIRDQFMESFRKCIRHFLHPPQNPDPGVFQNLEEVGSFLLTHFTTGMIREYLQSLPQGSTITFEVEDGLNEIPWELMLETAYAGEIPCRVGRRIVSRQEPRHIRPPVRGISKVRSLLIGDPTDDLSDACDEVRNLADRLSRDDRFQEPVVRIGSAQCQWLALLHELGSGNYGLIHYSGHTLFDGRQSAWQLKDGKVTTDLLTSALQNAPPALVFSSSCESATGGEMEPATYEDETFDLPGAFLQAGVEAYIGTLWSVESWAARQLVEEFYNAFLSGEHNLGECLRLAKWASKERRRGSRTDWLAFILYGDPHTRPEELFPTLRRQKA